MDVTGRRYHNIEELLDYCYHVAGVVGVMMSIVMGVRSPDVLLRAADLGIAFQLTNIARDIVDDSKRSRVYLPQDWLDEFKLPEERIGEPEQRVALQFLADRILATAEPYYASGRVGLKHLPFRAGWAVGAALEVYREIGVRIRARGAEAWDSRVSTGRIRKAYWFGRSGAAAVAGSVLGRGAPEPRRPNMWTKADLATFSFNNP